MNMLYTTSIAFMTLCQRIIASGHKTRQHQTQKRKQRSQSDLCTNPKKKKRKRNKNEEAREKRERNCVLTGERLSACCYCLSVRRQCEQSNAGLCGNVFRISSSFFSVASLESVGVVYVPSVYVAYYAVASIHCRRQYVRAAFVDDNHYHNHET